MNSDDDRTSTPLLDLRLGSGARIGLALERWRAGAPPSLRISRTSWSGHALTFAISHRQRFEIARAVMAWLEACDAPPSSPADALAPTPPASGPSGDADASEGIVVAGTR